MYAIPHQPSVNNIAQTTAFYRTLFGVEPAKEKQDYVKFLPHQLDLNIHSTSNLGPLSGSRSYTSDSSCRIRWRWTVPIKDLPQRTSFRPSERARFAATRARISSG